MLSTHVLVLNRSFVPVHVTSLRHALCLLYRGIAKVVDAEYSLFDFDSWASLSAALEEEKVHTVNRAFRVPRVILLSLYDRVPHRPVRFSRLNIYMRDRNTCQYCGKRFQRAELNLDHVMPVSLGGRTSWENVVCSCIRCNVKKGGRTPEGAGMKLLKTPARPNWSIYFRLQAKPIHYDAWKPFLNMVDFTYWNLELKE